MRGGESRMRRGRAGREESGGQRQTGGERKGNRSRKPQEGKGFIFCSTVTSEHLHFLYANSPLQMPLREVSNVLCSY